MKIQSIINERTYNGLPETQSFVASLMALAKSGGYYQSPEQAKEIQSRIDNNTFVFTTYHNIGLHGQEENKTKMVFDFDDQGITKIERHNNGKTALVFRRQ